MALIGELGRENKCQAEGMRRVIELPFPEMMG